MRTTPRNNSWKVHPSHFIRVSASFLASVSGDSSWVWVSDQHVGHVDISVAPSRPVGFHVVGPCLPQLRVRCLDAYACDGAETGLGQEPKSP